MIHSMDPTGSLNATGKSKRGKSMYRNSLSDFCVSALIFWSIANKGRYDETNSMDFF